MRQSPKSNGTSRGVFSLRSRVRPNPIGTLVAMLVGIEGATVLVRGSTVLTHRWSTSSPIAVPSRCLPRLRPAILRSVTSRKATHADQPTRFLRLCDRTRRVAGLALDSAVNDSAGRSVPINPARNVRSYSRIAQAMIQILGWRR